MGRNVEAAKKSLAFGHFLKTRMCHHFQAGNCRHGSECNFAHSAEEIHTPADLSKTSLCRSFMNGTCPLKSRDCRYAHGRRELRRVLPDGSPLDGTTPPCTPLSGKERQVPTSTTSAQGAQIPAKGPVPGPQHPNRKYTGGKAVKGAGEAVRSRAQSKSDQAVRPTLPTRSKDHTRCKSEQMGERHPVSQVSTASSLPSCHSDDQNDGVKKVTSSPCKPPRAWEERLRHLPLITCSHANTWSSLPAFDFEDVPQDRPPPQPGLASCPSSPRERTESDGAAPSSESANQDSQDAGPQVGTIDVPAFTWQNQIYLGTIEDVLRKAVPDFYED